MKRAVSATSVSPAPKDQLMCFSATTSYLAAGLTGAIGAACLARTSSWRERPLAAMPLLFAVQQTVEGRLWQVLTAMPESTEAPRLTLVFLLFAKVLWPVYAPLAALLIEPDNRRRSAMWFIFLGGAVAAAYALHWIGINRHDAGILGGHIVYHGPDSPPHVITIMYMLAACGALIISSHAAVRLFGAIVSTGAAITYAFYWQAFSSVWCFFAGAGSAVVLRHLRQEAGNRATNHAG